ncbi:MAG: hypothetical protein KC464_05915 [Myxococcales bacterium]|nr:hypothetical protein [Myxococcales bacterium]
MRATAIATAIFVLTRRRASANSIRVAIIRGRDVARGSRSSTGRGWKVDDATEFFSTAMKPVDASHV